MSVAGVEAAEAVLNMSIIARRWEIAVRINATETASHRKKIMCKVRVISVFPLARKRLSRFSYVVLVQLRVRHDIIFPSALHDRTLQHVASPLTMDKQYAYQRRAAVGL